MSEEYKDNDINQEDNLPELPLLPKIAIEGEVSSQYLNSTSKADLMVRVYILLKCVSDDKFPYYLKECKKYLEDEDMEVCLLYIRTQIFPKSLITKRFIEDLHTCIDRTYNCDSSFSILPPMSIKTLKSKLAQFVTTYSMLSPKLAVDFLDAIINDEDTDIQQFKGLAWTLKSMIKVYDEEDLNNINLIKLITLLQSSIMSADLLSFNEEMDALEEVIEKEKDSQSITTIEENESEDKVYVVNKIDKASGKIIFPKEFKTHSEASKFIHGIKNDYPELFQRYDFIIKIESKKGGNN